MTTTRAWAEQEIVDLLTRNDKVVGKAVYALFLRQTADEQFTGRTKNLNGRGFNGRDAKILTSFAKFWRRTGFLTPKQLVVARNRLPKYRRQLTEIANGGER